MPPRFYKHKLLLDEGLYKRQSLSRTNSRYNIRHIKMDLHKAGAKDEEIFAIACKQKRVIVTANPKDFKKLLGKVRDTGIIGVTQKLTPEQLDTKLNALLSKSTEKTFYGKYTPLGDSE